MMSVMEKSLEELRRLRGLLDGSVNPDQNGAGRRAEAIETVDKLGRMIFAALAFESEMDQPQPQTERRPFGFAAARRDYQ